MNQIRYFSSEINSIEVKRDKRPEKDLAQAFKLCCWKG